jgi:hypothetical protein
MANNTQGFTQIIMRLMKVGKALAMGLNLLLLLLLLLRVTLSLALHGFTT